jgi:hypothetical protein
VKLLPLKLNGNPSSPPDTLEVEQQHSNHKFVGIDLKTERLKLEKNIRAKGFPGHAGKQPQQKNALIFR